MGALCTTTLTSIYTVPAGKTVYLTALMAANYSANQADITIVWRDASASNADFELAFEVSVAPNVLYGGLPDNTKFFLNEGDQILVRASVASSLKAILSWADAT
jgi:hypothetical protein